MFRHINDVDSGHRWIGPAGYHAKYGSVWELRRLGSVRSVIGDAIDSEAITVTVRVADMNGECRGSVEHDATHSFYLTRDVIEGLLAELDAARAEETGGPALYFATYNEATG